MRRGELAYWPVGQQFLIGLAVVLVGVLVAIEIDVVGFAYGELGLSRYCAYALLAASLLGSRVNIPVHRLPSRLEEVDAIVTGAALGHFASIWPPRRRRSLRSGSARTTRPVAATASIRPFVQEETGMARCEVCSNDYDKTFQVVTTEGTHVFDSFECAIHRLAPTCAHCGCRVVGHGVEADDAVYCCASCALAVGVAGLRDRA